MINCAIAVIIFVAIIGFELRQMAHTKWQYFSDVTNLNDCFFTLMFIAYFCCDYWLGSTWIDHEWYEVTRILVSVLLLSGFIKLLSLNRTDNISFIVRMIVKVIVSIMPFLMLFNSLILLFCFIVYTLGLSFESMGEDNPYKAIGKLSYFIFLFRTSVADFDVD